MITRLFLTRVSAIHTRRTACFLFSRPLQPRWKPWRCPGSILLALAFLVSSALAEEADFLGLDLPLPEDFLVDLPDPPPAPAPTPSADPNRLRILMREAGLEAQAGNHEASVRIYRQVLNVVPYDRAPRFGLGTSLLAIGEYEEAERLLRELIGEDENDHIILNNLAWLYATARDIRFRDGERALGHARRALLMAPSAHYVWSTLAESYYVSGQYEQAVRAAEQAVRLAQERDADESQKRDYQRLLEKSRHAARAFEILE